MISGNILFTQRNRIYIKASRETYRDPIDHEHETTVRIVMLNNSKVAQLYAMYVCMQLFGKKHEDC